MMPVRDFMTKKVVYVSPQTTVAHAADIMREQQLRRLPVIENDQLVGLITEGTMADAKPSKATTLSIYEMNYLLNKTKVKDIMIQKVITVSRESSLEDAIYLMMTNKIGVLPVVDNHQLYGIITDKDVFKAFLEVSGYGEEGLRLTVLTDDKVGDLAKLVSTISSLGINIKRAVTVNRKDKAVIEIQIEGDADTTILQEKISELGFEVESIVETVTKIF